jgi:carboxylesterase
MIIKNAEPFFFPGDSTGCLLIHGFSSSPTEMHPLGVYLSQKGYTVLGVRLSGHATNMSDFMRSHWQDWYLSVLDGWHLIQSLTKNQIVIGLSTGGALAFYHASKVHVDGVIGLSTLFRIKPDPRLPLLPILSRIIPSVPKGESDWHDPDAGKDRVAYAKYSTRAVLQLKHFLKVMRSALPSVTAPTLLIHSKCDKAANPQGIPLLSEMLGTPEANKEILWVENSGHIITKDLDHQIVFNAVHNFIQKVLNSQL